MRPITPPLRAGVLVSGAIGFALFVANCVLDLDGGAAPLRFLHLIDRNGLTLYYPLLFAVIVAAVVAACAKARRTRLAERRRLRLFVGGLAIGVGLGVHVLEKVRGIGRVAALKATERGSIEVSREDFRAAAPAFHMTPICPAEFIQGLQEQEQK
jgi:hypothetical protein